MRDREAFLDKVKSFKVVCSFPILPASLIVESSRIQQLIFTFYSIQFFQHIHKVMYRYKVKTSVYIYFSMLVAQDLTVRLVI